VGFVMRKIPTGMPVMSVDRALESGFKNCADCLCSKDKECSMIATWASEPYNQLPKSDRRVDLIWQAREGFRKN